MVLGSVLGILTYLTNEAYEQDALASAREVSRVNAGTVVQGLRDLMMSRDTAGMGDLFDRLVSGGEVYRNLKLVSHDGGVVASSPAPNVFTLEEGSWPCGACHGSGSAPPDSGTEPLSEIFVAESGERVVSVVTPIHREDGCEIAGCHSTNASSSVLGLFQADFSLRRVDALIAQRNRHAVTALFISILLCSLTTWWMTDRLLGKRIRTLIAGAERIDQKDLSFRFGDSRGDGIARLSGSFDGVLGELSNTMSELRNTKEYLQGIVENSADIIITVDHAGRIRTFNTGAERALGYEREEVIGERIEMLFAEPSERDIAIEQLRHTDNVVNYETRFLTKVGEVRDVILTLSRLRTPAGEPIGTFGISKDVTEERRLHRELVLKEKLAAIGQTVTGIQHTLKNMLSSLKGGSYMVEIGLRDQERPLLEEGWGMVKGGVEDIHELCSTMLSYVREWEPDFHPVDLDKLITSVHKGSEGTARGKGIHFTVQIAPDLPAIVCDRGSIQAVLMDLLYNAFDACAWKEYVDSEKPTVELTVDWSTPKDIVTIEVKDNGQGMSDRIKEQIFKPFFSTKKNRGTGMGLTLASRTVRLHGGRIDVVSEPTRGSTFRVSLPVAGPRQEKEALDG